MLFVCLLDVVLSCVPLHTQDVIIVLLCKYFFAHFDLESGVLWCLRLFGFWRLYLGTLRSLRFLPLLLGVSPSHRVQLIEKVLRFLVLFELHAFMEKPFSL